MHHCVLLKFSWKALPSSFCSIMGDCNVEDCWVSVAGDTLWSLMDTHVARYGYWHQREWSLYHSHRLLGGRHCLYCTYRKYHQYHFAADSSVHYIGRWKAAWQYICVMYQAQLSMNWWSCRLAVVHYATRVVPGTAEHELMKLQAGSSAYVLCTRHSRAWTDSYVCIYITLNLITTLWSAIHSNLLIHNAY